MRVQLYRLLEAGMGLFTAGQRKESIFIFEQVLDSTIPEPTAKMTAACLLAECWRGMGQFQRAEQHYELSIRESENIPRAQRDGNGYFLHYRPRAHLGLLTVYRRTLFDDHDKIRDLLRTAKGDFHHYNVLDLMAQIYLVEGLYRRQLGEVSASVERLSEGLEEIRDMPPPFLFLHPEHFEALLTISHLCLPGSSINASRLANQILKADRGPWSLAVAAAVLLHLHFRRVQYGQFSHFSADEFGSAHETVANLIKILDKNAEFERDPLVISEEIMLEMIWNMLIEKYDTAGNSLQRLLEMCRDVQPPLMLLRAVELGALRHELEIANLADTPSLKDFWIESSNTLRQLEKALRSYGCNDQMIGHWEHLLDGTAPSAQFLLEHWSSEAIQDLRNRVWP